jgi:hypothetical protein
VSPTSDYTNRLLAADVGCEALRLALALELLVLLHWDKDSEKYLTERRIGETLLMGTARMVDRRSLVRARDELLDAGVILSYEPGSRGRGRRSLYVLVEKRVEGRAFAAEEDPNRPGENCAEERAFATENRAEKRAEKRADERGGLYGDTAIPSKTTPADDRKSSSAELASDEGEVDRAWAEQHNEDAEAWLRVPTCRRGGGSTRDQERAA